MSAFNMVSTIEKKKMGGELSAEEIERWIDGVVSKDIPDYQTAALLMAIRLKDMTFEETLALTRAMVNSGDTMKFPGKGMLADKHSTGGVGDKVTLILAPLLAACGLPVTMLSGRGLGFTGGTIDKFESLEGVSCEHDNAAMIAMLDQFGWANAPATKAIAPADRIIYAMRDVTATVDSIPLITASILSKKIAGGATHLCLDVKCGTSAFMTDLDKAKHLAHNLKTIGEMDGLSIKGVISRMEEPLGHAVGNYLELLESVHYLQDEAATPLMDLVYVLASKMLMQGGLALSEEEGRKKVYDKLVSGEGLQKMADYLAFSGASDAKIKALFGHRMEDFPRVPIPAAKSGVVENIDGRCLGQLMIMLGAGRQKADDTLDPLAGVLIKVHRGEQVKAGEPLLWAYGENAAADPKAVTEAVNLAYRITEEDKGGGPLILHEF